MKRKNFWGWAMAVGIGLFTLGSFVAFIPYVGLPIMGLGVILFIIGLVMLIPILIMERKRDNVKMNMDIDKKELRP